MDYIKSGFLKIITLDQLGVQFSKLPINIHINVGNLKLMAKIKNFLYRFHFMLNHFAHQIEKYCSKKNINLNVGNGDSVTSRSI